MTFVINLVFFFVVYLPAMALTSMVLQHVPSMRASVPAEWELGWNPILWLITTAPWQLPVVVLVIPLHLLARSVARRACTATVRITLSITTPIVFLLAMLTFWGPSNMTAQLIVPVALSAMIYAASFRIPRPGTAAKT